MPKGEANAAKTHCPHGHEYNDANTFEYRGKRYCRECGRIRTAERMAKLRELERQATA